MTKLGYLHKIRILLHNEEFDRILVYYCSLIKQVFFPMQTAIKPMFSVLHQIPMIKSTLLKLF